MSRSPPRRYYVYVIELATSSRSEHEELYVGSSAFPPRERMRRHYSGRRDAGHVVRRRSGTLRPDLYSGVNPLPDRPAAHAAELLLARSLERRGYVVYGACGRGCAL